MDSRRPVAPQKRREAPQEEGAIPKNGGNGYNPITTTGSAGEVIAEGSSYAQRTRRAPGGGGLDLLTKFAGNESSRADRTVRQPSGSGLEKFCEDGGGRKEPTVSSAQSRASYMWSCGLRPYTDRQKAVIVNLNRNHRLENPAAPAADDGATEGQDAHHSAAEWRFAPLFEALPAANDRPRRTVATRRPRPAEEDKPKFQVAVRISGRGGQQFPVACHGGETLAELKAAVAAATGLAYYHLRLSLASPSEAHGDVELKEAAPIGEQGVKDGVELVAEEDREAWHRTLDGRLFAAAREGDVYTVRDVVLAGANVNSEAKNGDSPLHVAALGAHCQVVSFLFAHGAERDKPNAMGHTPLHRAVFALEKGEASLRVLSLMLTNGCDPLLANDEGLTPLHLAASCADILDEATVASAHLMAVHGMDVTAPDMLGITPLLYAVDAKKPISALWFAVQCGVEDVSQSPELEELIRQSGDAELIKRAGLRARESTATSARPGTKLAQKQRRKAGWRR